MAMRRSGSVLRRLYAAVLAATAVVVVLIVLRGPGARPRTAAAPRAPVLAAAVRASVATAAASGAAHGHAAVGLAVADVDDTSSEGGALRAWVQWKYRYLLEEAPLDPASREHLIQLLIARESLVRDPDAAPVRDKLADIERQLDALLGADDRERYRSLRDSESEQRRLGDYGGGIDQLAPLDDDQTRRLLAAKLRCKAIFERELGDAHLDQPTLSDDERAQAYSIVNAALDRYRDAFLRAAAEILDAEQMVLLASYETTEMESERQRLQVAINAK